MSGERLVTLTTDGKVQVYTYGSSNYKLVTELNLKTHRTHNSQDSYTSLGVDTTGRLDYLLVSCEDNRQQNGTLSKFVLLEINSSGALEVVSQLNMSNQGPNSLVFDLGVIAQKNGAPQFYAFEKNGERKLLILTLVNGELIEVDRFENFHKDSHGMSQFVDGCLHAVEATGTLRILRLA